MAALAGTATANERVDEFGTRLVPEVGVTHAEGDVSRILFMNRCPGGCVVQPGPNSARANTSAIIGDTIQLSEFQYGDAAWQQVVACVKELYRPYDVEVTDVDPGGDVPHHEAIVAGTNLEAGFGDGILGVSPAECSPTNNNISFTFSNAAGNNPLYICSVVGQESAHSYGLEHSLNCADPMTYLPSCGRQFFRTGIVPCGEYAERDCVCGGTGQDVHGWLLSVMGPNPTPMPGPELSIIFPAEGATVENGFATHAEAGDLRGVGRVEYWLNGTKYDEREGNGGSNSSNYSFTAPGNLPDSIIDIEIKAYDDIGNESVDTITVTKGGPCTSADTCNAGQLCEEGRCVTPPPTGAVGDVCERGTECVSGMCVQVGDEKRCSEDCYPLDPRCESGFECLAIDNNNGVCWPAADDGGGDCGCEVGSSGSGKRNRALLPLLGLLMLGLLVRGGRRKR